MILGIFLGIIAAKYERSKIDYLITAVSLAGYSAPVFWAGMMVMLIFSVHLGWFPTIGMTSLYTSYTGIKRVLDILHHLVLPSAVLGMWYLATYARLTRTNMLEVLKKDYITTARAKGLEDRAIYYVHAFRNAMLPVITVIGLNIGHIVVGAVITETVFSWPGIGSLLNAAVNMRDYTLLMGLFIITSVSVILTNLVTDCIYAFIDPRIRYR
jgi:peptide/nickel transport system permease protein